MNDLPLWATDMVVAVDTETSGLHPDDRLPEGGRCRVAVVTLAWLDENDIFQVRAYPFDQGTRDKLVSAQMGLFGAGDDPNLGSEEWYTLLGWLAKQKLVFHNAKFDLMFLKAGTRHWPGVDLGGQFHYDTMVGAKTLDPTEPVGLADCEKRAWGTTTKVELDAIVQAAMKALPRGTRRVGGAGNHDLVEWDQIEAYAANDARLTIELYYHQQDRVMLGDAKPSDIWEDQELTRALYRMESRGIRYDVELSRWSAAKLTLEAEDLAKQLPFPATPDGAKRYYFQELGKPPFNVTDKGKPQFALEDQNLAEQNGWPWAAEYAEVQKKRKAVSMWYGGYADATGEDGRLRTNYRQLTVRSGRMSVERVQLQAIPKDDKTLDGVPNVRALFIPEDGKALWNLDLGQAELRIATLYADCTRMAEMLRSGADLHGITTTEIFKVEPGGGGKHNYKTCHCDDCEDFNVKRDIAKRLTFGGIFQIGAATFQATLARLAGIYMSEGECQEIVRRWRSMYPEFGVAYRQSEQMVRRQGWVPLVGGRYRSYFNLHRPPVDFPNTAWNRRVQGSLAKFNQLWLIETHKWMDELGGELVLNVHDSLVLEVDRDSGADVAAEVARRSAKLATDLFGTEMTVDVKDWEYTGVRNEYAAFQAAL